MLTSSPVIVFQIAAAHLNILGTLGEFLSCFLFPEFTNYVFITITIFFLSSCPLHPPVGEEPAPVLVQRFLPDTRAPEQGGFLVINIWLDSAIDCALPIHYLTSQD